jgi:hypothetical protein
LWKSVFGNENVVSSRDSISDERKFLHRFELDFGPKHPKFFDGTFKEAVNTAKTTFKPLCVYIHSSKKTNFKTQKMNTKVLLNFVKK